MEGIQHNTINVNGLNIHIAEKGAGPLVLFLHGFPELWYSWRHQILYLADHGYRAVAPDLRGYGQTTGAPINDHTKFTILHLVGDLIGLLDAITNEGEKVFLVGHDWGALIAWYFCMFRPDRVIALVNLSVTFAPWNPYGDVVGMLRQVHGDDHYMTRFQYSWRHQIVYLTDHGYRAVAPDLRGYGQTTGAPINDHSKFTIPHVVGDLIGLLDAITNEGEKVFVVGHDWGALIAWNLCMFRPDRVKALVNLSVAFFPWNPKGDLVELLRLEYGEDHYMTRFQKPGEIEAEFAKMGYHTFMKKIMTIRDPGPFILPKGKGFPHSPPDVPVILPPWLSEQDIEYFATQHEKAGITGGLNYYRALHLSWELTSAWRGAKVTVPAKFVVGDTDLAYYMPGVQDYIHNGGFKKDVPLLEEIVVMEGVAHFINQEKPDEINKHIVEFIQKF